MTSLRWRLLTFCMAHSDVYQRLHHRVSVAVHPAQGVKVFCLGPPKTGTSSLYVALKMLGFRSVRFFMIGRIFQEDLYLEDLSGDGWARLISWIRECSYDAFVDYPLGLGDVYVALDRAFPGSKFILTTRDSASYAVSFRHHFQGSHLDGELTEEKLAQRIRDVEERNQAIEDYFRDRPGQLLVFNLAGGDGWPQLCAFLEKSVPDRLFPRKNVGRYHRGKK